MATSFVFVDTDNGRRLGIAKTNPPFSGGRVIDTFEHDEGTPRDELLRIAADRNGPLRLQTRRARARSWGDDSIHPATRDGLDEAWMIAVDLTTMGLEARIITSQGVVIPVPRPDPPLPQPYDPPLPKPYDPPPRPPR